MDRKRWIAVAVCAVLLLCALIAALPADEPDETMSESTGTASEETTMESTATSQESTHTTERTDVTTEPIQATTIPTEGTTVPTEITTVPTQMTTEPTEQETKAPEETKLAQPIVVLPQFDPYATEATTLPAETEGLTTEPEETLAPTEETTAPTEEPEPTQPENPAGTMRNITTMELVQEMGMGINLGNTFEAYGEWIEQWTANRPQDYYTSWGSPIITREIIKGYADAGFGVLRIPVHWMNLMAEDCTLSDDYMAAVRQVVDWALEEGLYVIINIHHDEGGFFSDFPDDVDGHMKNYTYVWRQIAEGFRDYDDHLIFEAMNEEGGWDDVWNRWGGISGKAEAYSLLNAINQAFVDTVRATGGNNAQRHLLISGYVTDIELTCDPLFALPDDPAGRFAVSVHYYTPSTFTILEEDASWGTCRTTWGTDADFRELNRLMDLVKNHFIDNGIPVIMGEFGCTKTNKDASSVRLYLTSVCEACLKRGICPILWDTPGLHYDRSSCRMIDGTLHDQLLKISEKY